MPITTSHGLRKKKRRRIYKGENSSFGLVRWMNGVRGQKAKQRITLVLETCQKIDPLAVSGNFPVASVYPVGRLIGNQKQFSYLKEFLKMKKTLDRALSKYKMYPSVAVFDHRWRISWVRTSTEQKLTLSVFAGGDFGEFSFGEGDAVSRVLALAEEGLINRIRRCKCGMWFYARFKHQIFCGTPCQERDFRKTPEGRAKRRDFMRKHRKVLAEQSGRIFRPRHQRIYSNPTTRGH